jgi:hypothetical protein
MRWVPKMHFFPFDYIEKQKFITKYKQILPTNVYTPLQTNKKVPHSTFETGLLKHNKLFKIEINSNLPLLHRFRELSNLTQNPKRSSLTRLNNMKIRIYLGF